ncbi:hypothetical protein HPULCUR_001371 [Helicostylum pulchrum]|uniref:CAP-Gly domain-containing protein n=1 Tax=Helicostylum pulchrum TaxID=562976 RepID=A0ABP9XMI0_9FUNG
MSTKLKLPSIPVRTPKNRFQSEHDEANKIGQRVTIPSLDNCTGVLRYVGEPDFKAGVWAGIELDKQGEGKNDGSVQGKRYFVCSANTGIFIAVNKIIIHPPIVAKKKPSPTTSTRRSNLPINRSPSNTTRILNTSSSSTTTSTKKKTGLRISSVPSSSSSVSSTSTSNTTTTTSPPNTTHTSITTITPPPMTRKKSTPSPATAPVTPPPPPPLTPTPPPPVQEKISQETNQLYEMLEKVQRERDSFQLQMKNKETAWERLVSSKESLSLQVEEKEYQNRHLQRELEEMTTRVEDLERGLAERDAVIAKTHRDDEKTSQDQRRIERLETLVRELQAHIKTSQENQVQKEREYQGAIDQMRREVNASESMTASLEKECEELRRDGLEAIHAYEDSVIQINDKHEAEMQRKNQHISNLDFTIADLKHKQYTLFDDDEKDIETRLKELSDTVNSNDSQDQRHRLEEQLELTMTELDSERKTITSMSNEIEQLKSEVNTFKQQSVSIEQKFQSLQTEIEMELRDKKRLIEEADNAFEQQAKAEDEHYQLKLSKMTLEKEFNEMAETNKQLEADYIKLMDEMMILEKQDASSPSPFTAALPTSSSSSSNDNQTELRERIKTLEREKEEKMIQVKQLYKDLSELESLVENKVFGEAELEEKLEDEKNKVLKLSRELNELKSNFISPTTSSIHGGEEDLAKYCELCEKYGHDLIQCKNTVKKVYCDNCDDYGNHITEDCPNQDETF